MRSVLAAVAVILFLVGLQAAFGGGVYVLGSLCARVFSECVDTPLALIVIGIAALVATLWLARACVIAAGSARRR